MVIEVIRGHDRYVKECLPELSTRCNGVMPIDDWSCAITGAEGFLIGRGSYKCVSAAISLYGRNSILTHYEPNFSDRCLSEIKKIVGQPTSSADIAIVYRSGSSGALIEMREGLRPLFPGVEICEVGYSTTVDYLIFDIERKKLFLLEQDKR